MLKFYYGTKLEKLADKLFDELQKNPLSNPLAEEVFVVQNHGIGQWLSLRMAEKEGIAANLKFEFPSERIWALIRSCNPEVPQTLPSDRQPMTWTLMSFFEDESFLSEFPNLHYYIQSDDPQQQNMRSWKLASKIADVFDQYLIYRPNMIINWEQRKLHTQNTEAENWQAKLWRRLLTYWKDHTSTDYLHRASLQKQLLNSIDADNISTQDLPSRITIFGVSTASPAFIETMVKLAKQTEVHFYQLAVDANVQQAQDFKNPLLQSIGIAGTQFIAQLSSYIRDNPAVEEQMEWGAVENSDQEPSTDSLFKMVQSDLKRDATSSGRDLFTPSADSSIQIHSCHSPMREVQVLYDQLLDLLNEHPELHPDDVLVMTTDMEQYAPMIDAVFGMPDEGQPEIPYAIADQNLGSGDSAIQTFLSVLKLVESRFKVTDVLDLLDSNPICEAFNFTDDDLNRIEQWVTENRIRWGIDGKNKVQSGLPDSDHFTWRAGLRRMLLGFMMRPSEDQLYDGIYAYDEIGSSDDADLVGRLATFLNLLFEINEAVNKPKTPDEWGTLLHKITVDFIPDNQDYFWELSQLRNTIQTFTNNASLAGHTNHLPYSIVRRWLTQQLEQQATGGGRIGRGVTFSSLMPMRSIPYKVIGMLGMNEDAFPRSKIPVEFDLMHLDPQLGDPGQSSEDRYLFLENLLSARSHIYISYVGQSNRDDAKFPPSVVVNEFQDYVKEQYQINPQDLTDFHRLQPFSADYFLAKDLFSFSNTNKKNCTAACSIVL